MGKLLRLPLQFFAESDPAPAPPTHTATPPVTTPPQAVTVDMDTITKTATEAAEKKMQAVFKSMLAQQGLDAETINKMTAEFKAKQKTPEQELQAAQEQLTAEQGEKLALQRRIAALGKGVPADKADKYIKLAEAYLCEDGDFDKAMDAALQDFPVAVPAAQLGSFGSQTKGGAPGSESDFTARLAEARKNNNNLEAIKIKQEASKVGINLL